MLLDFFNIKSNPRGLNYFLYAKKIRNHTLYYYASGDAAIDLSLQLGFAPPSKSK